MRVTLLYQFYDLIDMTFDQGNSWIILNKLVKYQDQGLTRKFLVIHCTCTVTLTSEIWPLVNIWHMLGNGSCIIIVWITSKSKVPWRSCSPDIIWTEKQIVRPTDWHKEFFIYYNIYCMCIYCSGIHILAELVLFHEYTNMFDNNRL